MYFPLFIARFGSKTDFLRYIQRKIDGPYLGHIHIYVYIYILISIGLGHLGWEILPGRSCLGPCGPDGPGLTPFFLRQRGGGGGAAANKWGRARSIRPTWA